ncbi:MAG: O-antigen ligase family protein [Candidatus Eisenbacteria bacterium]|nr:O-antigen ligase family protein [Candidatus Eisenbacteria bacterium]
MTSTVRSDVLRRTASERKLTLLVLLTTAVLLASVRVRLILIAALALAGIISVILFVLYPFSALCVLAFLAYGNVSAAFLPGVFSGLLVLTLIAWVMRVLLSSDASISRSRVDVALIIYVSTLLVSMLFSPTPEAGGPPLLLSVKWLIFYVLVSNIVRTQRHVILLSVFVLFGAGLSGFAGLWTFSQQEMPVTLRAVFRAAGLASNPNELAIVMVTALPISIYVLGAVKEKLARLFFAAITLTLIGANLVTLARTGLIVMVVVLLIIAVLERRRKWGRLLVAVFVLALPLLIPRGFWVRFAATGLLTGDSSALLRTGAMTAGLRMFTENPITGVGFGAYLGKSTQYGDIIFSLVAHNMYLHVLAESGILGLGAMLFLIWSSFRNMRLAEKAASEGSPLRFLARGYVLAYVAFLLCGLLTSIQLNQSFWFMPAASVFFLRVARGETSTTPGITSAGRR